MAGISIDSLTRDYGKGRGIFDVSFSVDESESFGFLGPNGAGKTTAIRHLMGFLHPRKGTCSIAGMDCWKSRKSVQEDLGYVPGEIAFPEAMTGEGFLRFYASYRGMKNKGRKDELIERFELDPSTKIRKMSKGTKQKLGLVAAFMHDPRYLILDEPTSGLDPLMQNRFVELIDKEKERGKTILMSSHMFEEVEKTCTRVGIIRAGRMAAIDTIDSLKARQIKKYEVTLANEQEAKNFTKAFTGSSEITGTHVTVTVKNNISDFIAAMAVCRVTNISAPEQTLEDAFLHFYGGEEK